MLKAIGAKSRIVLIIFLKETILTGLVGVQVGILFGFALGQTIGAYINMPRSTSLNLLMLVTAFAIITSALSGLYPAWRATNLNPMEALRHQ